MKVLSINEKHICDIPSTWDDLMADQVKFLCKLSCMNYNKETLAAILLISFCKLQILEKDPKVITTEDGITNLYHFNHPEAGALLLSLGDIHYLTNSLDFLFSTINDKTYIQSKLFKSHFPVLINRKNKKLFCPDSALFNFTLEEFIRSETLYHQFKTTDSQQAFYSLLAVICRPEKKNINRKDPSYISDPREAFLDHKVQENSVLTIRLNPWQQIYLSMYYEGCRAFIIDKFPSTFSGSQSETSSKSVFEGFLSLVTSLCDGDVSKAPQIRKSLLWDVLQTLEDLAEKANKIKQLKNNVHV